MSAVARAVDTAPPHRWHPIAFEYPAAAKAGMRDFVDRAAAAVRSSETRSCDVLMSSDRAN